ncbi:restriction endonuclease fold toxin 5 domain-containing protein [Burkholderia gladioli]|uniref:restriction endonuclease fold toxin 5 domain-containing protein n=1 Tax=Burkholderia gladioli TaxID=28095 RepID=UPI001FC7EACC|nr:restriction endonuclease fold toxin 5 domain-containing protein [Burkholderia gladioli]
MAVKRFHSMNAAPREYQGRVTGRPYSVAEGWSEEWAWLNIDFDGFVPGQCLLQEAKGNYDQFLEMDWAKNLFFGWDSMTSAIIRQGRVVRAHPPTRLTWYFQGPKTRDLMRRALTLNGIQSVFLP